MRGIVVDWEFMVDVEAAFKVGKLLVEAISLHAVFDAREGFVFLFDFGHNGPLVNLQLHLPLVVVAVVFHFSKGSRVFESTG